MLSGALAIIPSAIGVSEYTMRENKQDKSKYGSYVAQSVILSLATVLFVLGVVMYMAALYGKKQLALFTK